MKTLAIIGTAGRGSDILHLNRKKWEFMLEVSRWLIADQKVDMLVSGGAAWADHCVVEIDMPKHLWLPAWQSDLGVAQKYHKAFSKVLKRDTWDEVMKSPRSAFKGFKDRNALVARDADLYLACTFGERDKVKNGGTAHTVGLMSGKPGWHLNLFEEMVYELSQK